MRIHNLYTDASGQSHFRDINVEWAEETRAGKLSKRLPATGIIFRQVPPTYDLDWHPAPRRQYIINLDAGVQITASDGESRVIGAGVPAKAMPRWRASSKSRAKRIGVDPKSRQSLVRFANQTA